MHDMLTEQQLGLYDFNDPSYIALLDSKFDKRQVGNFLYTHGIQKEDGSFTATNGRYDDKYFGVVKSGVVTKAYIWTKDMAYAALGMIDPDRMKLWSQLDDPKDVEGLGAVYTAREIARRTAACLLSWQDEDKQIERYAERPRPYLVSGWTEEDNVWAVDNNLAPRIKLLRLFNPWIGMESPLTYFIPEWGHNQFDAIAAQILFVCRCIEAGLPILQPQKFRTMYPGQVINMIVEYAMGYNIHLPNRLCESTWELGMWHRSDSALRTYRASLGYLARVREELVRDGRLRNYDVALSADQINDHIGLVSEQIKANDLSDITTRAENHPYGSDSALLITANLEDNLSTDELLRVIDTVKVLEGDFGDWRFDGDHWRAFTDPITEQRHFGEWTLFHPYKERIYYTLAERFLDSGNVEKAKEYFIKGLERWEKSDDVKSKTPGNYQAEIWFKDESGRRPNNNELSWFYGADSLAASKGRAVLKKLSKHLHSTFEPLYIANGTNHDPIETGLNSLRKLRVTGI